jgi:hypothetical protein
MSLFDTLLGIFTDDDTNTEFNQDPEGFLNQNGLGNVTSQDIQAEMPRVLEAIQGNSGGATQGGAANFAGSGNVTLPPPPAPSGGEGGGYEGGLSGAIESINHYTNVINTTNQQFEDNDVTNIDDRDTTVDSSVNQNITAFGDVNQDFDNDVVSGDGAVAAGDGSQVNTGAGAVQAGDDIEDSNVVTGSVTDSVLADDIDDSIIGDDNQAIIDSNVGAATFGEGDATNVSAQNANVGDGVQVVGSDDTNVNTGEGDLITIDDSTVEESQLGGEGNTLVSNDVDIDAQDGSAVAFGAGSEADAQQQNVNIEDNYGQVQVAGDDATQTVDQSSTQTITDSYNDQSVNESYNVADSGNVDASDDDGIDVDNSLNQNDLSDDDGLDVG